jgi:ADP-ribosylglycohydrolase
MKETFMDDKGRAMVLASFCADSLALGAHWIYSTEKIAQDFGRVDKFLKPKPDSFHPTKQEGEFTHYGDQAFVLLESLAACHKFDPDDFSKRWQDLFRNYNGYFDHATKDTLKNLAQGKAPLEAGSDSNELSAAARIAPLVYGLRDDEEELVKAVKMQAIMTHRDSSPMDAAEFFARVCFRVLQASSPVDAVREVGGRSFGGTRIRQWVEDGLNSCDKDSVETIKGFGQSCPAPALFPGVIHLICKYENDLKEALVQAVMAGGDSAARGMSVGMILGAHLGMAVIPDEWVKSLKKGREIEGLLNKL